MRIIVDANIIFSGILNTNSKIGDLIINSKNHFEFIAPDYLRLELKNHYNKLCKISGLSLGQIQESEYQLYKRITFISAEQIKLSAWLAAEKLVADVDPKDVSCVAFSKHFKCKIWSGDKALIKGLSKKNFTNFISTTSLYELRESLTKI